MRHRFSVTQTDGLARKGRLETEHGPIDTPAFMPVGTCGAVKGLTPKDLAASGAQVMLANLYHLALRPGIDVVERHGGLHEFTGWRGPILTDSGGYQVFSLAGLRAVDLSGVWFRSHIDGAELGFTPESVVSDQERMGVDIAMMLDECPPATATRSQVQDSLRRTTHWAERARAAWSEGPTQLFGIAQGGVYEDLREQAVEALVALDFPGYAIGGVSVGEPAEDRERIVRCTVPLLPADRPRYLMGVGTPLDILQAVRQGVDLFDCVLPSRNARHGFLFTRTGPIRIKNARFREDTAPIDEGCACRTCATVSRAFVHHLIRSGELTGTVLATLHNVRFFLDFARDLGEAIASGKVAEWGGSFTASYTSSDLGETLLGSEQPQPD
ncbi:MAG: tRNA guanosine(34) transglycosylase Tgt [Thermoanaerobaculia bacterium]